MPEDELLKMNNIHKWYGNIHALQGVDFHLDSGEIVGLVGDNGAGKSTLIKILSGIHKPSDGQLFLEGDEVNFNSPKEAMNKGIETIHQETALVDSLDIKRNMFLGKEPPKRIGPFKVLDVGKMARESKQALHKVGLAIKSTDIKVNELSGGQRQGVAIARALHFESKLLIMDEPTNNLSVKETKKVYKFAKNLSERGVSCIFITHNINDVYPIADRIVVLQLGEKIADLDKEETSIQEIADLITK